jgi:2-keto-3-deoxy-L-rhamnonate aldolase RhmA
VAPIRPTSPRSRAASSTGRCACDPGPDDPVLNRVLQRVWAACAAAAKPVGVHAADGTTARRYRDAGCTVITTATDAAAITRDTTAQLSRARA